MDTGYFPNNQQGMQFNVEELFKSPQQQMAPFSQQQLSTQNQQQMFYSQNNANGHKLDRSPYLETPQFISNSGKFMNSVDTNHYMPTPPMNNNGYVASPNVDLNAIYSPMLNGYISHTPMLPPAPMSNTPKLPTKSPYLQFSSSTTPIITYGTPHMGTPYIGNMYSTTPHIGTPQIGTPQMGTPHVDTPFISSPFITSPFITSPYISNDNQQLQRKKIESNFNFQYDSIDDILDNLSPIDPMADLDIYNMDHVVASGQTDSSSEVTQQLQETSITDNESANKPWPCTYIGCDKVYTRKYSLGLHIKTTHEQNSPSSQEESQHKVFRCTIPGCDKSYNQKYTLKLHINSVHNQIKPFKCDQQGCKMRFSRQHDLSRHLKTHSGEKSFYCQSCSKGFGRKEHLKSHLQSRKCKDQRSLPIIYD